MNKNHQSLIRILLDASFPVLANTLAKSIGVSIRSIKNYVDEINRFNKQEKVILSFPNGYAINKELGFQLLRNFSDTFPQNYSERSHYIIKRVLSNRDKELDIYDLSEELHVSDSTVKNDISKMNSTFSKFDISFNLVNDYLTLQGDEKSKRKLFSYVLSLETQSNFMNLEFLKETFDANEIDTISNAVKETIEKHDYYINDFSLMNFVLHLTIIINRIKNGKTIRNEEKPMNTSRKDFNPAVIGLTKNLELAFNIEFNYHEISDIEILFTTAASISNKSFETIKQTIDQDIMFLTNRIVNNVKSNYFIDLGSDTFIYPFALHLQKLIGRIRRRSFTHNPMVETIKNSCPLIYDIAVFISLEIKKSYNYLIPENEITFIALHLGSEIENQELNSRKIKTLLLCPNYGNLRNSLYASLLKEFGDHLNIVINESEQFLDTDSDFELLLSTSEVPQSNKYQSIVISPFQSKEDNTQIYAAINTIRYSSKNDVLKHNFYNHFSSDLFFVNPDIKNKYDAIHLLSSRMVDLGYVDTSFEEQVLEREKAGSTAFVNIAIPHSVKAEAFKTCVGIIVLKDGIKWDDKVVNIVYLIALNEVDRKVFNEMYEALVLLTSKESSVKLISECTTFDSFRDIIMFLVSNDKYQN